MAVVPFCHHSPLAHTTYPASVRSRQMRDKYMKRRRVQSVCCIPHLSAILRPHTPLHPIAVCQAPIHQVEAGVVTSFVALSLLLSTCTGAAFIRFRAFQSHICIFYLLILFTTICTTEKSFSTVRAAAVTLVSCPMDVNLSHAFR